MADFDWTSLLASIYGYTQQKEQGPQQYELAQDAVSNAETWGQNYLDQFRSTYANELAGKEYASETAYRTSTLADTKSELTDQAKIADQQLQARLNALGVLRGSGQKAGSQQISDAQLKALAKVKTQIDAQILGAVQQRQGIAKQGLMEAESQVSSRVGQSQDIEAKTKMAMLQSLQLTLQQLQGVLPLVGLGVDYAKQIGAGEGFNIDDTLALPQYQPTLEQFNLSEGEKRYTRNPKTGEIKEIAGVPKTIKPPTGATIPWASATTQANQRLKAGPQWDQFKSGEKDKARKMLVLQAAGYDIPDPTYDQGKPFFNDGVISNWSKEYDKVFKSLDTESTDSGTVTLTLGDKTYNVPVTDTEAISELKKRGAK